MLYSDARTPASVGSPHLAAPTDQLLPATAQFTDLPTWTPEPLAKKPLSAVASARPELGRIPQLLPS